MLIFCLEKEHQPPRHDPSKVRSNESRLLNGFADDGHARQIASECRDKGWCCIYSEDMESLFDEHHRDGKAGSAAQIDDAAAVR